MQVRPVKVRPTQTRSVMARLLALILAVTGFALVVGVAPATAAAGPGELVVTVTAPGDAEIQGEVSIYRWDAEEEYFDYLVSHEIEGTGTAETTLPDAEGDYYASFGDYTGTFEQAYSGGAEQEPSEPGDVGVVTVTAAAGATAAITLTPLPDPVEVSGSVVDADTEDGIAEAYVYADGSDYDEATTDGAGDYTLQLRPGSYELTAEADGYFSESVEVQIDETTTELAPIELEQEVPGVIVSVLDDTFGGRAAGATVRLQPATGAPLLVESDEDGEAYFKNIAPGTYVADVLPGQGYAFSGEPETIDYAGGLDYAELAVSADLSCTPASANTGLTNMGFENGLSSWTVGFRAESITAVGADAFTTPWEGSSMARLGQSRASNGDNQRPGPNVMCQDFVVDQARETFAFNVFTYDYTGFDELTFDLVVTDPDSGETLASYQQGAWGQGTDLKTSGWRGVELDLADHVGDTVRLSFRAGGTRDNAYAFWVYLDSAQELPPTVDTEPEAIVTETGSVTTDPVTGQVTVAMPFGDPSDLTMTVPAACTDPETEPTSVSLILGGEVFAGTPAGDGTYTVTIPEDSITSGQLSLEVECQEETTVVTPIGQIVLYDPSGIVSDAVTGEPVVGATVHLYKVPGWTPRTESGPHPEDSCETNESKEPGAAWSQPAPTDEGMLVNAASPEISPNVNPFITNSIGYYGWDVAEGCWYVEVAAEGYADLVSPVVGVPSEVTDLDLELQPATLENVTTPKIAGQAKVGATLTVDAGEWAPAPDETEIQWFAGEKPIAGADGSTYRPVPGDLGKQLHVEVTASADGYGDGHAVSESTAPVAAGTLRLTRSPKVTGTAKVGKTVRLSVGTVSPKAASTRVQWLVNGKPVAKATGTSLKLTKKMAGKSVSAKVTYVAKGYATKTATAKAVKVSKAKKPKGKKGKKGKSKKGKRR